MGGRARQYHFGGREIDKAMSAHQPLMTAERIERSFMENKQQLHVLRGISLKLYSGEVVMLKGRSGSGKTTLLNLLGGLDLPDQGEVYFKGDSLVAMNDEGRTEMRRKYFGIIIQT